MESYASNVAEEEAVEAARSGAEFMAGDLPDADLFAPVDDELFDTFGAEPEMEPPLDDKATVRCLRCLTAGRATPPTLAVLGRRAKNEWVVLIRQARPGLPRAGQNDELWNFLEARYPHRRPMQGPTGQLDRDRAELLGTAKSHVLSTPPRKRGDAPTQAVVGSNARAPFTAAPKRGRFTIDCGRGHVLQTTAQALIRLAAQASVGADGRRDAAL